MNQTVEGERGLARVVASLRRAAFVAGAAEPSQLLPDTGAEVAFAGRSNAGKSSAINALTGRRSLARTSKTPGRTREINFFDLGDGCRLVDLPGYGFARAPREAKARWSRLVEGYLTRRVSLRGLVLLSDARHPLTELDEQLLAWAAAAGVPVHVTLTKADKLSRGAAAGTLARVRSALRRQPLACEAQLFSATHGRGLDVLTERVARWLVDAGASGVP